MSDSQKSPSRWSGWLLSLYLNGLFQTFVVCFVVLAAMALTDGGQGLIPLACLTAGVVASLFATVCDPFLRRWRQAMLGGPPQRVRYLVLSALLSLGMLLWSVLSLALLLAALPYLLTRGATVSPPSEELLPSLDLVLDNTGQLALLVAWLAGWTLCLLTRQAVQQQPVPHTEPPGMMRRLLGLLVLLPYAWTISQAGSALLAGGRLDPSLRQAYQSELQRALEQPGASVEKRLESALPADFREARPVKLWLAGRAPSDRNELLGLWCQEAARLSQAPSPWNSPALVALARLGELHRIAGEGKVPPQLLAEWIVRSQVILLEWGGADPTLVQRLYEMRLPAVEWQKLLDLALARDDLSAGASLSEQSVRERFLETAVRALSKSDYDMDGKLQRQLFQRSRERAVLNRLWQNFQAGKPYPSATKPPSFEEFQRRYAPSLAFDLRAVDADIRQATFKEDLARQNLAYTVVLLELKRRQAAGEPLPTRWDQFPPALAALGEAYADWIELIPTPQGVSLRQREPRGGMGLTHRFTQARTSGGG
jgi:hypothetical protein